MKYGYLKQTQNGSDFGTYHAKPTENFQGPSKRESYGPKDMELFCAEAEKERKFEEHLQVSGFCNESWEQHDQSPREPA